MAEPRLTDDEIHEVATRVRDAMRRPLASDAPAGDPAGRRPLGREDEDRVSVALTAMRREAAAAGADPGGSAGGTPG